jgi:hypothetical protein
VGHLSQEHRPRHPGSREGFRGNFVESSGTAALQLRNDINKQAAPLLNRKGGATSHPRNKDVAGALILGTDYGVAAELVDEASPPSRLQALGGRDGLPVRAMHDTEEPLAREPYF